MNSALCRLPKHMLNLVSGWTFTSFCIVVKTSAFPMEPMVMSDYVRGILILMVTLGVLTAVYTIVSICGLLPSWLKCLRKECRRERHQFPVDVEAGNPRSMPLLSTVPRTTLPATLRDTPSPELLSSSSTTGSSGEQG